MLQTGETWARASGAPSFLSLDENSFRSFLRQTDNDLGHPVKTLLKFFKRLYEFGEPVPPYYTWRVAVILRRARLPDEEKRFLAAWCRHYSEGRGGKRYLDLVERYGKLMRQGYRPCV